MKQNLLRQIGLIGVFIVPALFVKIWKQKWITLWHFQEEKSQIFATAGTRKCSHFRSRPLCWNARMNKRMKAEDRDRCWESSPGLEMHTTLSVISTRPFSWLLNILSSSGSLGQIFLIQIFTFFLPSRYSVMRKVWCFIIRDVALGLSPRTGFKFLRSSAEELTFFKMAPSLQYINPVHWLAGTCFKTHANWRLTGAYCLERWTILLKNHNFSCGMVSLNDVKSKG